MVGGFIKKYSKIFFLNSIILLFSLVFLLWVDSTVRNKKSLPRPIEYDNIPIYRVNTQRNVYDIYKSAKLLGARVIHLSSFFNMEDYFPKEEISSTPFPIQTYDIRPEYEKGLNSHNYLFIATRTGLVRKVTTVLPEEIFRERVKDFASDYAFTISGEKIKGYVYDIPLMIVTPFSLPLIKEPVVVNVDAGFFVNGIDPYKTAQILKVKCPDIRMVILVDSIDEPDVTAGMREKLRAFEMAWTGRENHPKSLSHKGRREI